MTVQFIEINGRKMAVLPKEEYEALSEQAEDAADIEAAIRAEKRAEEGEEYIPGELMDRLLDGENPVRVWREYRGFSQQELGDIVGLSKMSISSLETGKRETGSKNWRALAKALNVELEEIFPED